MIEELGKFALYSGMIIVGAVILHLIFLRSNKR